MEKQVKILSLVSYQFLPPNMGGQKCIAYFNRYLSKKISLSCITTKNNSKHADEGYCIENILSNSPIRYINPLYFFKLRQIIRQKKITHLIIEHPYYGWLGILLKWICKVKLIVHAHNIEAMRFKSMNRWWWGILWNYEKITYRMADSTFFITDEDQAYAISKYKLVPQKCSTITYGVELSQPPSFADKQIAREQICITHDINHNDKILLFNGTLGYKPNLDALDIILEKINPQLQVVEDFKYKIIICGSKLPDGYQGLIDHKEKNIVYAGFVEDINLYFKGADIFINPVIDGGGIKTKVVESLGFNLDVISTASGAIGIPVEITGGKLVVVPDNDCDEFGRQIILHTAAKTIPAVYFEHFYWGNIAAKAVAIMK